MKRIQSACICQTLHFMLKEDAEPAFAAQKIQEGSKPTRRGSYETVLPTKSWRKLSSRMARSF